MASWVSACWLHELVRMRLLGTQAPRNNPHSLVSKSGRYREQKLCLTNPWIAFAAMAFALPVPSLGCSASDAAGGLEAKNDPAIGGAGGTGGDGTINVNPGSGGGTTGSEPCNGFDDNGDGVVDEGCHCTAGSSQECYPLAEGPVVGACRVGKQACSGAEVGGWNKCEGFVLPEAEVPCDGIDQDCDGADLCDVSCKLRYRFKDGFGESAWQETAPSGVSGTWKDGAWALAKNTEPNTTQNCQQVSPGGTPSCGIQVGVSCETGGTLSVGYNWRGNANGWPANAHTPTAAGPSWADGPWVGIDLSTPCSAPGGHGGCSIRVGDIAQASIKCEVRARIQLETKQVSSWVSASDATWSELTPGLYSKAYEPNVCNDGDGCGVQMGISCTKAVGQPEEM